MRYLTKDEMQKVLTHAIHASRRDYLMILLGLNHGLRASEIVTLKLSDVSNGEITVARLKGSNKTTHPLSTKETEALAAYLQEEHAGGELLFPLTRRQLGRVVKQHMLAVGIAKELAHPHSLKHACCSIRSRSGKRIEDIATYVGHVDIKNTRIYLNISDAEAAAAVGDIF
jgi:type 1 fimbriae regulatory protein FimB